MSASTPSVLFRMNAILLAHQMTAPFASGTSKQINKSEIHSCMTTKSSLLPPTTFYNITPSAFSSLFTRLVFSSTQEMVGKDLPSTSPLAPRFLSVQASVHPHHSPPAQPPLYYFCTPASSSKHSLPLPPAITSMSLTRVGVQYRQHLPKRLTDGHL
ncbi:hypothetical protein P692DRAFT_20398868 [Suillus brevipes Sb2]|nr:hypothetical protein P692DRAFT_20398868 [Suillus brevipes Sb2]